MEKSRSDILSEIQQTLSELKARIAAVEQQLASLPPEAPEAPAPVEVVETAEESASVEVFETVEAEPADAPAEVFEPAEAPAPEVDEASAEDTAPIDISIDIDEADFPAGTPQSPLVPDSPREPLPEPADEELSFGPVQPKTSINDVQERRARKAVVDVMGQKLAWKTAMPGTPVKNVISAISLNDRVLFINTLFKEDPLAFQEAIAAFNAMSSFGEAEEYVRANYPEWNLNSDLVFRLMMAVRRKLR